MLQNWFILLPEICLISFLPCIIFIDFFHKEKISKTCFLLAQFFVCMSIAFSVLFYNKSAFPNLWLRTPLNTLFIMLSLVMAWAWFYLSSKWFVAKNLSPLLFYSICMMLLLGYDILASASSILSFVTAVILIFFFTHYLILQHWDPEKVLKTARIYKYSALIFSLLLGIATVVLYQQTESFSYEEIRKFYSVKSHITPLSYAMVLMIFMSVLFLMAVIPFHFWFLSVAENCILPVCGFITLVPSFISISALINLTIKCFAPFNTFILPILALFSGISLIVGALSANNENNVRKLFSYINIYCIGIAMFCLNDFTKQNIMVSFAYILTSIVSLGGIYTIFLGMKSKGDYLVNIENIKGFSEKRPYMSAALLVFVFSLIGLSPTVGFLGIFSIFNNFSLQDNWGKIFLIMIGSLFIAAAGLRVIRTVYFESLQNKYDRADKAIYICLFVTMVLLLMSLVNPTWLMHDILIVLGGAA